jgi:hypothetical protein
MGVKYLFVASNSQIQSTCEARSIASFRSL